MTREELEAERDRITAKLKASTKRDGTILPGATDRVRDIKARLEEIEAELEWRNTLSI
jgi:hypothetical protein